MGCKGLFHLSLYRLNVDEMNELLVDTYFMDEFRAKLEDPRI